MSDHLIWYLDGFLLGMGIGIGIGWLMFRGNEDDDTPGGASA